MHSLVLVLGLALPLACKDDAPKAEPNPDRFKTELIPFDEPEPYPAIEPDAVEPLDVIYVGEPVGEGYRRVPVRMSKPLHSGKWLGLANGDAKFMGPRHVIVNHFRSRPDFLGEGDLDHNVLLDVETGEVVAEFERGRYVEFDRGLAIVFRAGDERPWLLDAESGKFVLAVPEGEHRYVYGKNYELRFSPLGRYLWVTARDEEGTVHLYAWQELDAPPELPNNPFPFEPRYWDPKGGYGGRTGDFQEVTGKSEDCTRAILTPPKGYRCLDELELEDTDPLSEGWRIDKYHDRVFNIDDGRGYDLSKLCPEEQPVFASIRSRVPPQLKLRCGNDPSMWMLWEPPMRVRQLDPKYASRMPHGVYLVKYDQIGRHVLFEREKEGVVTSFDKKTLTNVLVGTYRCPDLDYRASIAPSSVIRCNPDGGRPLWFELMNDERAVRSRFDAHEALVGAGGHVVAVVRRGNRDVVVRLSQ